MAYIRRRLTTGSKRKPYKPKLLKSGAVPEKVIQKQILVWLESTGLLYWRQNAGFVGHLTLGPKGISDIVVIVPPNGRFLGLEVKSAAGTLRPHQKTFRDRLEAAGGVYVVVRSLDQAKDAVAKAIGEETFKWKAQQRFTLMATPIGSN